MKYKYPKTHYLPFSPSIDREDKIVDTAIFKDIDIVATLKMDGENTTMYHDYIHARSIDSKYHASRTWVKNLHATICSDIPEGWRICGENIYATHSIRYKDLESFFMVFSVWDRDTCLAWKDTIEFINYLKLILVPVLYLGKFNIDTLLKLHNPVYCGNEAEGYVIRNINEFKYEDFNSNTAKYVREKHVQTDKHWMHSKIIKNKLVA